MTCPGPQCKFPKRNRGHKNDGNAQTIKTGEGWNYKGERKVWLLKQGRRMRALLPERGTKVNASVDSPLCPKLSRFSVRTLAKHPAVFSAPSVYRQYKTGLSSNLRRLMLICTEVGERRIRARSVSSQTWQNYYRHRK